MLSDTAVMKGDGPHEIREKMAQKKVVFSGLQLITHIDHIDTWCVTLEYWPNTCCLSTSSYLNRLGVFFFSFKNSQLSLRSTLFAVRLKWYRWTWTWLNQLIFSLSRYFLFWSLCWGYTWATLEGTEKLEVEQSLPGKGWESRLWWIS